MKKSFLSNIEKARKDSAFQNADNKLIIIYIITIVLYMIPCESTSPKKYRAIGAFLLKYKEICRKIKGN